MVFLRELSKEDLLEIKKVHRTSKHLTERNRAMGLLLSHQNLQIKEIVAILDCNRKTVSRWIKSFNRDGRKSLFIADHPGRSCILSEFEEDEICNIQKESPRSTQEMLAYIHKNFNKKISRFTLKAMYKKKDLSGNVSAVH